MGEKYVHVTKVRSRWGAHSTRRGPPGAARPERPASPLESLIWEARVPVLSQLTRTREHVSTVWLNTGGWTPPFPFCPRFPMTAPFRPSPSPLPSSYPVPAHYPPSASRRRGLLRKSVKSIPFVLAFLLGIGIGASGSSSNATPTPASAPCPEATVVYSPTPVPTVVHTPTPVPTIVYSPAPATRAPEEQTTPEPAPVPRTEDEGPASEQDAGAPSGQGAGAPDDGDSSSSEEGPAAQSEPRSTYYRNCDAARAAGAAPLYRGEPGYRSGLDRDNDGIACEWK